MAGIHEHEHDAVVVGAGSAGAAAAYHLAGAGLRVALLDARPLDRAGARWVDDVPPWMFDLAEIPRPEPPEKRCDTLPVSLLGPLGRGRVRLTRPMWGVDMRLLTARLRAMAEEQGVLLRGSARVTGVALEGQRPVAVEASVDGRRQLLRGRLLVDATGRAQSLLRRVPRLSRWCPPLESADLCSAAQRVCRVADRDAARRYLQELDAGEDEIVARLGMFGGFSTRQVHLHPGLETVELLLGAIQSPGRPSGLQLLDRFAADLGWVGEEIFGGQALIPVRRPYDRLTVPGLALVGDAACQVFPAHGSGVGGGLVAARMLARNAARHVDPGCEAAGWGYQQEYQRTLGGVNAAYEAFRRAIEARSQQELEALMEQGLVPPAATLASLDQRMPRLSPAETLAVVRAATGALRVAGRMAPVLPRMEALHALYALYPRSPNRPWLRTWSRMVARVGGWQPDL